MLSTQVKNNSGDVFVEMLYLATHWDKQQTFDDAYVHARDALWRRARLVSKDEFTFNVGTLDGQKVGLCIRRSPDDAYVMEYIEGFDGGGGGGGGAWRSYYGSTLGLIEAADARISLRKKCSDLVKSVDAEDLDDMSNPELMDMVYYLKGVRYDLGSFLGNIAVAIVETMSGSGRVSLAWNHNGRLCECVLNNVMFMNPLAGYVWLLVKGNRK